MLRRETLPCFCSQRLSLVLPSDDEGGNSYDIVFERGRPQHSLNGERLVLVKVDEHQVSIPNWNGEMSDRCFGVLFTRLLLEKIDDIIDSGVVVIQQGLTGIQAMVGKYITHLVGDRCRFPRRG